MQGQSVTRLPWWVGLFTIVPLSVAYWAVALFGASHRQAVSQPPGRAVINEMRAAYAGKWFTTLTFEQKTTIVRPDGTKTEQTWFESMRSPDVLRIDVAPLSDGNGSLNFADKVIVVRGGKVANERPSGNPFLPFVAGIYTQPVETSIAQLAPQGYDLTRTHTTEFQGRRTTVVGTATRDDLTVPQFWVDTERLVVVRALLHSGAAGSPLLDVVLDNYVKSGASWVATKITMSSGGTVRQVEEYTKVRTNVDLPADLFDPARWTTAAHWAR